MTIRPLVPVELSDPAYEVERLRHATANSQALGRRADVTYWSPAGSTGPLPLDVLEFDGGDRSVLGALVAVGDRRPAIRFDCGTTDPLIEHNRALHHALAADGIDHEYEEFDGGHEWPYWRDHLPAALRFVHRQLTGPGVARTL